MTRTGSKRRSRGLVTLVVLAAALGAVAVARRRRLDAARHVFYERFGEP